MCIITYSYKDDLSLKNELILYFVFKKMLSQFCESEPLNGFVVL